MTPIVRASLEVPTLLRSKRRLPPLLDLGLPERGVNQPMSSAELRDPSGLGSFSLLTSEWPVGNGHGPALGPEKRAARTMSPGMASLYDENTWQSSGDLVRKPEVWAPGLPAWQGRSPNFFGLSPGDIGAKITSFIGSLQKPNWLKPGIPMTAAGAAAGGAAGTAFAGLSNYLEPGSASPTNSGLLGALLGAAWGHGRKH